MSTTKPARYRPDPFALLMRDHCSECHYAHVRWMQLRDLPAQVGDELRAEAAELVDVVGADADAWLCPLCGYFGAFGPTVIDLD